MFIARNAYEIPLPPISPNYYGYIIYGMTAQNEWSYDGYAIMRMLRDRQQVAVDKWITQEHIFMNMGDVIILHDASGSCLIYRTPNQGQYIYTFHFADENNGLICGYDWELDQPIMLHHSGGNLNPIAMPPGYSDGTLTSIWMTDADHGYANAYNFRGDKSVSGEGELFRYDSENWTLIEPPSGCEGTETARFMFVNDSYGVAVTRDEKYWLLDGGVWSCEDRPFGGSSIPILHVSREGLYYLGSRNVNYGVFYQIYNGQVTEIEFSDDLGYLATLGSDTPLWSPMPVDGTYDQPEV